MNSRNTIYLSAGQYDYGCMGNKANKTLARFASTYSGPGLDSISRFPNVRGSQIVVRRDNLLMERYGISKRIPSGFELLKGETNNKYNNYLNYVVVMLNHLYNTDVPRYWEFATFVAQRSKSFKALMLQEVFPDWQRAMTLKEVYLLVSKFTEM